MATIYLHIPGVGAYVDTDEDIHVPGVGAYEGTGTQAAAGRRRVGIISSWLLPLAIFLIEQGGLWRC